MASKDLVRRFDLDTALAEIAYVGERSRSRNWIFCDANFGILKRDVEIARAIRAVHDKTGAPRRCHIWLSKNATERNLQIAEILGDMSVPVMAVQSLSDEVLAHIKRDNISTDTYVQYQQRFHKMGHRTYSDLIVPLPAETLDSHLESLRNLFDYGVDIIQSHHMRLLAGAETNTAETRGRFGFRTRYRLIHGDAGAYRAPDGTVLQCLEYEESLRETKSMSETQMFYLRKLHFLVDFFWNMEVYRPLLEFAHEAGVSPVDVMRRFIEIGENADAALDPDNAGALAQFWREFNAASVNEWFDSAEAIETYFADPANFDRLIGLEFDKLNILFSVTVLKDYKAAFNAGLAETVRRMVPDDIERLRRIAEYSFARFPPLDDERGEIIVDDPASTQAATIRLTPSDQRATLRNLVNGANRQSLSKILNTAGISLRNLRYAADPATLPTNITAAAADKSAVPRVGFR